MAALRPFRALRPTPDVAPLVAAVPYDVVTSHEARHLATGNPLSFLHVSRPEIDLPIGTDPHADRAYAEAATNFESLKRRAPLVLEASPSLYVYRLTMGSHVQTGVAGTFELEDYDRGVIKKHEHTRRDKEDDRTRHMLEIGAQTGPVFLTYRGTRSVNEVVDRTTDAAPLFDFVAPDDVRHTVWVVANADVSALLRAFGNVSDLYIADGHHRAASAARARNRLRGANGAAGPWDLFLAVAFPHDQVRILPYNRVVKDLAGHTPDTFLATLRSKFQVEQRNGTVTRRGDVGMFLEGHWYRLELGPPDESLSRSNRLDVSRLQAEVLTPILGIGDIRSDARIEFVGGVRGTGELELLVRQGRAAVAFAMYPVSIADLMAVCDAGGILPPKSTWFEPKLRDGLLSHVM